MIYKLCVAWTVIIITAIITVLILTLPTIRNMRDVIIMMLDSDLHSHSQIPFRLANYYSSSMVLQSIPHTSSIWGFADPNHNVSLKLGGQVFTAVPAVNGKWKIVLNPMTPGGPHDIEITHDSNKIIMSNVYFGDVWLCSGQSNMQFGMGGIINSSVEIQKSLPYKKIRYMQTARIPSTEELEEPEKITIGWTKPEPGSLAAFSALCFLHARYLYDKLKIPIGLIESDWGGTRIESWSSQRVFDKCNETVNDWNVLENIWAYQYGGNDVPYKVLWNGMIYPYLEMTISGVLWYQGEANVEYHRMLYSCVFPAMIQDWRMRWHESTAGRTDPLFPFGFMQLAMNNNVSSLHFPNMRWHQTADVGNVPNQIMENTFMAVGMDLLSNVPGNYIHPRDKLTMARRLSYASLNQVYMKKEFPRSGPTPLKVTRKTEAKIFIVDYDQKLQPPRTRDGFQICCGDINDCHIDSSRWLNAAIIGVDGASVTVTWTGCDEPTLLSYAWLEQPCAYKQCALYSHDEFELPALTWMFQLTNQPVLQIHHYSNPREDNFNPRRKVLPYYH